MAAVMIYVQHLLGIGHLMRCRQIAKALDSPLYGHSGNLESLDFVNFIMEVEEKIKSEFGVEVTIADENLLSREKSPFSTLGSLIEYLENILDRETQTEAS